MKPSKHPSWNFLWPLAMFAIQTQLSYHLLPSFFFSNPTFSMKSMTHHRSTKALEQVSFSLIKAAMGSLPRQVAVKVYSCFFNEGSARNLRTTSSSKLATGKWFGQFLLEKWMDKMWKFPAMFFESRGFCVCVCVPFNGVSGNLGKFHHRSSGHQYL